MMRLKLGSLFRRNIRKHQWRREEVKQGREKSAKGALRSGLSLWAVRAQYHWVRTTWNTSHNYPIRRWEGWSIYSSTPTLYWLKFAPESINSQHFQIAWMWSRKFLGGRESPQAEEKRASDIWACLSLPI